MTPLRAACAPRHAIRLQVLKFCAKHDILPDTELIGPEKVNDVYKTLREGTAGLKRYVIDIGNI